MYQIAATTRGVEGICIDFAGTVFAAECNVKFYKLMGYGLMIVRTQTMVTIKTNNRIMSNFSTALRYSAMR